MEYSSKAIDLFQPENRPPLFLLPGLHWDDAALCAELSRLAYFHFEVKPEQFAVEVGHACKAMGLEDATFFNDSGTNTQAFAVRRPADGHAFVAFRGTQPDKLMDCLIDAKAGLAPWDDMQTRRVHQGFLEAYNRPLIKSAIREQLRQWQEKHDQLQVTFTGHSLGAALATLAAADHAGSALVTFGSPRVGNSEFARAFDDQRAVHRYVDCCDVVTTVPLHVPLLFPYEHLAGRHYIDSRRKIRFTPSDAEVEQDRAGTGSNATLNPLAILAATRATGEAPLPRFLTDHAIINYILPLLGI